MSRSALATLDFPERHDKIDSVVPTMVTLDDVPKSYFFIIYVYDPPIYLIYLCCIFFYVASISTFLLHSFDNFVYFLRWRFNLFWEHQPRKNGVGCDLFWLLSWEQLIWRGIDMSLFVKSYYLSLLIEFEDLCCQEEAMFRLV